MVKNIVHIESLRDNNQFSVVLLIVSLELALITAVI